MLAEGQKNPITFAILYWLQTSHRSQPHSRKGAEDYVGRREQRPPTPSEFCLLHLGCGSFLQRACILAGEMRLTLLNHREKERSDSMASRKNRTHHTYSLPHLCFNDSDKDSPRTDCKALGQFGGQMYPRKLLSYCATRWLLRNDLLWCNRVFYFYNLKGGKFPSSSFSCAGPC